MNIRYLINKGGVPFDQCELQKISKELDELQEDGRRNYRDQNANAIAKLDAAKILIISGPGTGKSFLFLDRIKHWFKNKLDDSVLVTSFVRKLVADLQNDIQRDKELDKKQKQQIVVATLHKFARSIVEKNHGTSEWQFQPYFRIIGQFWKNVVWSDVFAFYPEIDKSIYTWRKFEEQLHNDIFEQSDAWQKLKETYFKLCKFYNAAGFADLILRAKTALIENNSLNKDKYFIIDEYQDFNTAEDNLIIQLANNPRGLLIVGDDEQVLYEQLKSSKATLIRNRYRDNNYTNAMLPFCSRCGYHITKAIGHFIQQQPESECIRKIFLPLKINKGNPKVQIVACATPVTAVDYIEKFIEEHKNEINERKTKLSEGKEKDAFLLILTPAKKINFFGKAKEKIFKLASNYQTENKAFSEDYYKLLSYYSLSKNNKNNLTFRKVLFYEGFSAEQIHAYILKTIQATQMFCNLDCEELKNVFKKCDRIKNIIEEKISIDEKIKKLLNDITIDNKYHLKQDLEHQAINSKNVSELEHREEEEAELEEIETKKMSAVEVMTIVGSKGLSADNVIVLGFDNVNMDKITKNAFYVAMARARNSLHLLTTLKSGGATKAHTFLEQLPEDNIEFYSYKKGDHSKNYLKTKQDFINYLEALITLSRRQ